MRKVDEMGYVDIDRIGHGGHSYGAFTTANLLAHTPFFKAGIAGDGAYNRTLTPMSFQGERRNIWEAPTTYLELSPFFYADRINTPLLMYHGAQDNNSGTFLIQSERMIQALTGLGKDAVLYIYPFESHAPRAKENLLDLWARWLGWFDHYVKQTPAAKPTTGTTPTAQQLSPHPPTAPLPEEGASSFVLVGLCAAPRSIFQRAWLSGPHATLFPSAVTRVSAKARHEIVQSVAQSPDGTMWIAGVCGGERGRQAPQDKRPPLLGGGGQWGMGRTQNLPRLCHRAASEPVPHGCRFHDGEGLPPQWPLMMSTVRVSSAPFTSGPAPA